MKKKLLTAALCLAVSLACSACGGNGADGTSAGKTDAAAEGASQAAGSNTVVVAMGSGFSTLDPGYVYEKYPPLIVNACYENLFKFYSNDSAPEPCLADTYEFSEDGLTLTVKLKQDVTFASGNPMTSADVLFSINRCKNLQGNPSFICDTIESMEAPDDYTVVFHLTQADSAILSKLTYSSTAVLDSAVVKEHGGTDAEDASSTDTAQSYLDTASAGSGMYVMTSYIPDQEVVLEKNPNYWGEATNVDKYIIKIQPDANTQMMTLSGGDIDVAMNMTDDTMSELEGAENISIINGATKTVGFVMMNMDEAYGGPVSNPQVQNAIRRALDYTGIQTICGSGTITPYDIIQVGFMGSKGERPADYTNLEEAKALLAEAGYPDGFTMEIAADMSASDTMTMALEIIKEQLAQVGINAEIKNYDESTWLETRKSGELGSFISTWTADYNDPDNFIYTFFGNAEKTTARSLNYPDTAVMERVAAARTILDNDERMKEYNALEEKIISEDAAWVPMFSRLHLFAVSKRVQNFKVAWNGLSDNDFYPLSISE